MNANPRHLGKYELQQLLGQGAVGEIWKAYDLQLHRDVALKILHTDLQSDPYFLTHFTKEGQVIASLHHGNIVQVHDVNLSRPAQVNETAAYIVMEYVPGQTLAEYIRTTSHRGAFPSTDQITYLFTSLGEAIDYAHQKGIVHGNIKPSNVLLNAQDQTQFEAGEPMLTDFGLAQLLGEKAITAASYVSPEQAKGLPASPKSDIYSLGIILYEICTGVPPFRDESSVAVMMQHINTLPTHPMLINPHIPPALAEVILRVLAKDPVKRFRTATEFAFAIAEACSTEATDAVFQKMFPLQNEAVGHASHDLHHPLPPISQPLSDSNQRIASRPNISQPLPQMSPRLEISQISQPYPRISTPLPAQNSASMQRQSWPTSQTPAMTPSVLPLPAVTRHLPVPVSSQAVVPLSLYVSRQPRNKKATEVSLYVVVAALLLLLLVIGSAIGAFLLNNHSAATDSTPGYVYFQSDALSRDDQLRLQLQHVPAPPDGKSYVGWLEQSAQQSILLGQFTFQDGAGSLLYTDESMHRNLLSIVQDIIVTTETTNSHPNAPTSTPIYRATFSQATFQQIKDILDVTPDLPGQQSVIASLLDTIKSMNDKAGSIVDTLQGTHDYPLVKRQATRIIEVIDGTAFAQKSGDLGKNQPLLNVDPGLLSSPSRMGYLDILSTHLDTLKQAAGNNSKLLQHVQNIENAITDLRVWLQKSRTYAIRILKAPNVADPAITSTALQLQQEVSDAYTGRTIPPAQGPQSALGSAGANQAYVEAQYLATMDLQQE